MIASPLPLAPAPLVPAEQIQVEFFESPLTPELWAAYEAATHSYGCTREFLEHFESPASATLALVRSTPAGHVRAAFLYQLLQGGVVRVLGRFFAPSAEHLGGFAAALFARHGGVTRIETDSIDALSEPRVLARPVLALREIKELRIPLPGSVEGYERMLHGSFLKRTQVRERRLAREHPSTRVVTLERDQISRALVADVVRLNRERRASKNGESVFDEHFEEGIYSVARAHGYATVVRDGDRVCAGVINVRCGADAFFWVNGHDNGYNKFSPGTLCLLASIRYCVARGVRTFHLLDGESDYKKEVGGRPARLASYVVLRSWAALKPRDVTKLFLKHSERAARSTIDVADAVGERVFKQRAPVKSFARDVVHRMRRIGRA
jgi:CelD/BcsL family acetyltransferase involved in cellulose biosynthesis